MTDTLAITQITFLPLPLPLSALSIYFVVSPLSGSPLPAHPSLLSLCRFTSSLFCPHMGQWRVLRGEGLWVPGDTGEPHFQAPQPTWGEPL